MADENEGKGKPGIIKDKKETPVINPEEMIKQAMYKSLLDQITQNPPKDKTDFVEAIRAVQQMQGLYPLPPPQPPQENKTSMQDMFGWMMMAKMMGEGSNRPPEKNELMEIIKTKLIMDAFGSGGKSDLDTLIKIQQLTGKKEGDLDSMIKLMQAFGPKEDKTLEYLKQQQELQKLQHENEMKIAEEKERHEKEIHTKEQESKKDMETLRTEIADYKDQLINVSKNQNKSVMDILSEQLSIQAKLQSSIQEYASAMGWGPKQNLPAVGEKWSTQDYMNAIDQIGKTISTTVSGITSASKELRTVPPKKEVKELQGTPIAKEIPTDIREYLEHGTETADGFIDMFGNFIQGANGTKLTKQQIETYVRQNDATANDIRNTMNMSKKAYENMQQQLQAQQQAAEKAAETIPEAKTPEPSQAPAEQPAQETAEESSQGAEEKSSE